jgi:hypothetical protein
VTMSGNQERCGRGNGGDAVTACNLPVEAVRGTKTGGLYSTCAMFNLKIKYIFFSFSFFELFCFYKIRLGVVKRAESTGPTRLTHYFVRAGLRYSARDPKLARPI